MFVNFENRKKPPAPVFLEKFQNQTTSASSYWKKADSFHERADRFIEGLLLKELLNFS